ncbi:MAG: DMT family transporter [Alphaproteobacteria bacterium]|nr:DMT family transporter [Alphaproteobacteria bacterium]
MAVQSNLRGIAAMLAATGTFVANDTCVKLALDGAPLLLVLTMRGAAACLWCLPILITMGHARDLGKVFEPWVMLRSLLDAVANFCFVLALANMPIADVIAVVQITPFLVLLGAWLLFGEKIGGFRMLLVAIAITGAILVAQPGGANASPFALFGFLTAVGAAGRDIVTRKVPRGTPAMIVTFSTLLAVSLAAGAVSLFLETPAIPSSKTVILIVAAGFFVMCGQLFIYLAYRMAAARAVAPFSYSFMIWAGLSGFLVFEQVPNGMAVGGMVLILLSGLVVILLEGRTRQGERPVTRA